MVGIDDKPRCAPLSYAMDEDGAPITIRLDCTDSEVGAALLDRYIAALPSKGDLYWSDAVGNTTIVVDAYNVFATGRRLRSQYVSSVLGVSSFWGGAPYSGYHPMWVLGEPDCHAPGECADAAAWVTDASERFTGFQPGHAPRVAAAVTPPRCRLRSRST